MPSNDRDQNGFTRVGFPDPKLDINVPVNFKTEHIFHGKASNTEQLQRMLKGLRPFCEDRKSMHVHHIIQRDHADGGSVALLSTRLHQARQLHKSTFKRSNKWRTIKAQGGNSTIDRASFNKWSKAMLKAFAVSVIDGVIDCPTLSEAERNSFKNNPKSTYHTASKFAQAFKPVPKPGLMGTQQLPQNNHKVPEYSCIHGKAPSSHGHAFIALFKRAIPRMKKDLQWFKCRGKTSVADKADSAHGFSSWTPRFPNPGGIEIAALKRPTTMPKCKDIQIQGDVGRVRVTFGDTKYWIPIKDLNYQEIAILDVSVNSMEANRICVDVHASPDNYSVFLEGGLQGTPLAEYLTRADFLLGAFVFGREPKSGRLFKPKVGQLRGYKNPVLEAARLLKGDPQYAAARCRYRQVWLHPTLVCDQPFSLPASSWLNWSPQIQFPKTVFRLVCRLVLVDPFGKTSYYDIPESSDKIHEDAEVLLRPYKPLLDAFKNYGAEWIASEPELRKVENYARIFQLFTIARSDGVQSIKKLQVDAPLTHFSRVNECTYLHGAPLAPGEVDIFTQELKAAMVNQAEITKDNQFRATMYQELGLLCSSMGDYDSSVLYLVKAVELYNSYDTMESSLAAIKTEALVVCLPNIVYSISKTCPDWIFNKSGRTNPAWWKPLHALFGPTLEDIDDIVNQLRSESIEEPMAKVAAPFCLEMLVLHLGYDILARFEHQQDIHGISGTCNVLSAFFRSLTNASNDSVVERPWSNIRQMSEHLEILLEETKDDLPEDQTSQYHPLGTEPVQEDPLQRQESLADLYFVRGEFAEALASVLVVVELREALGRATLKDLDRLWGKAAFSAQLVSTQRDLVVARKLIEGVNKTADESSTLSEANKTAMLSYLEEANRLLVVRQDDLPRSSITLQSCVHDAIAKVYKRFSDLPAAFKWTNGAHMYREAAKSLDDEVHLRSYAGWLLNDRNRRSTSSYKCTDQWQLMTTRLVTIR
ncbi:hypothetical protein BGX31_008476 [Mortierella sp. GBA43]|nr:hypothetical protein BGX31_008476 [Mortierella sp. GBA43]